MNNSNTAYVALFESIRAKCQRVRWFGPDFDGPKRHRHIPDDAPERSVFLFPPAMEGLLRQSEEQLGFALPPLLRALYAQVANGGFGPGLGIPGVLDGYGRPGDSIYGDNDDTIVAQYRWRSHEGIINLADYREQWKANNALCLPYGQWPDRLIPLSDMGCVQQICVDAHDEHTYMVAAIDSNESYGLFQRPWTLEEWLWRWIQDEKTV